MLSYYFTDIDPVTNDNFKDDDYYDITTPVNYYDEIDEYDEFHPVLPNATVRYGS